MKITIFLITIVLFTGCQTNQQAGIKSALGDALIVGQEVEQIEREKGDTKTADQIKTWVSAGQQIYDTGSIADNCDLMLSVTGIAYDWLKAEYPDRAEYKIPVALLRVRLETYCGEAGK